MRRPIGLTGRATAMRQRLERHRFLRPFAHRLGDAALWRFTRTGVARGAALGLFAGFILPVGQVVLAVVLAVPSRANLLVASLATLVTNPLTFPAIYYAAYGVGRRLVGESQPAGDVGAAWVHKFASWAAGASLPTFVGLLLFALAGLVVGYAGVRLGWRLWIGWRWARRAGSRGQPTLSLPPL